MEFITNEKLTIVGAAGMIGSNMAQTAIMMHLTPRTSVYTTLMLPVWKVWRKKYSTADSKV